MTGGFPIGSVTCTKKLYRVTELAKRTCPQILLIAPTLLGEALAAQLNGSKLNIEVSLHTEELSRHPSLVIWSLETLESPKTIQIELRRLKKSWKPSPILLLLPEKIRLTTNELLEFESTGLLQAPDFSTLNKAITTLIKGGRIVSLRNNNTLSPSTNQSTMGLSQWLLLSGLQQINKNLEEINFLLEIHKNNILFKLLLISRRRELRIAKSFLYWLWGPLKTPNQEFFTTPSGKTPNRDIEKVRKENPFLPENETNINLRERTAQAVWETIHQRLNNSVIGGIKNQTGNLLAIDALNSSSQKDLLLSLLNQLSQILLGLNKKDIENTNINEVWLSLQIELKKQALQQMTGSYVQLPLKGKLENVSTKLLETANLLQDDEEMPSSQQILDPLIHDKPILVEGKLLASDDPRALLQLEVLISNWLVRSAEIIAGEILDACSEWPELRRYLLKHELISTRELERLRNQLNSQTRWQNLIQRPIHLYESKRLLYSLRNKKIEKLLLTELRDEELRKLGWFQQQVALILEARDALAPQVQSLTKKLGDLMVILLTQVIGRAIGLIGRGIAQGMGRSFGRG